MSHKKRTHTLTIAEASKVQMREGDGINNGANYRQHCRTADGILCSFQRFWSRADNPTGMSFFPLIPAPVRHRPDGVSPASTAGWRRGHGSTSSSAAALRAMRHSVQSVGTHPSALSARRSSFDYTSGSEAIVRTFETAKWCVVLLVGVPSFGVFWHQRA